MKVDTQELKARMLYHNRLHKEVAELLGINKSTLSAKLRSGDFKISEIHKLIEIIPLNTKETVKIFFAK